jgi:DNA-binding MarR family transcriptional regulator
MDPVLSDERITSVGLFIEAHAALARALERASQNWGGMPTNFEVLMRLARSEGQRLRMADLAAQTGLTPSGVSRAVDRLSADGLVTRVSCPSDARGAFAQLTPKGNKVIVSALKRHVEDIEDVFVKALSRDERAQLEAVCRTLRDKLNPCASVGT